MLEVQECNNEVQSDSSLNKMEIVQKQKTPPTPTDDESNSVSSSILQSSDTDFIDKFDKKNNDQQCNCYCGKERNLNIVELLCANCGRWFHESCIGYQLGKLVPFLSNYIFLCKNCSPTGLESFKKSQAQITQMCITALANLQQSSLKDGTNRTLFSKDKEIIPYIEYHWEALTTTSRRVTQSWHSTVHKALVKDIHILFVFEDSNAEGQMYGLVNSDITQIKPNYEAMIKGGTLKVTDMGIQHGNDTILCYCNIEWRITHTSILFGYTIRCIPTSRCDKIIHVMSVLVPVAGGLKSRNTKRKLPGEAPPGKKGRGVELGQPKLPAHGYPLDHPFNKDGYRYLLAEPDPHAPYRQEFDESSDWAGKPIPGWLYRTLVPGTVLLALHDRAPQLKISEDRLAVTGEKGYSTVRATHFVTKGAWYWEATIEEMPESAATRMGWGQDYANLQAPIGYDKFGYSWRSRKGTKFHESAGKHYGAGYGEGDTLGFMIVLPQNVATKLVPNTYKDKPLVKFKSHLYYEEKDNVPERLKMLKELPGSKILFFKNGRCQGIAFENIYQGSYYPTVSVHRNATISVNYGPNFKHPPNPLEYYDYKGICHKAEEAICEQTIADMVYLTENEGKLRLDNFVL